MRLKQLGRREFITLIGGAAAWPFVARAQHVPTIGILWPGAEPPAPPRMYSFRQALRQLGFVEGQNLAIEIRYAPKGLQQIPELAAELVGMKVDVLTTFGDHAPKIAQQATNTIPIVAISDDIVGAGLITSLSHPDRNTTGLTIMSPELSAKRLEVLQEMVPGLARVACLWDPTTGASQVAQTKAAARSLNLNLQIIEVRRRDDVTDAFRSARDARVEAMNVFSSPFLAALFMEIISHSAEYRLPAIYQWKEHVEAGGLVSFGPSLAAMFRQAGTIVVKILKGTKPSELPVEQPTKFEMAVNARTAKVLGISIPPSILVRADEVIE